MTGEGIFNKPLFNLLKSQDFYKKYQDSGVYVTFKEPENLIEIEGLEASA